MEKLPSSIGNLSCLLTLRIDFTEVVTLPNVFWKLKRLRHLYLPRRIEKTTKRLQFADLTELRMLVNFPAYCADIKDLTTLTNLRRLEIVAYDNDSLHSLRMMFMSPIIAFGNLRDLSFSTFVGSLDPHIVRNMRDDIISSCPRLLLLKSYKNVVYQKTADIFSQEEDQLP
ncbi:uncharacterized protein LOC120147147 [Hibiscus syriacus]|uniref:uncharacterized protein LOC120147147 n=1 Tax=Hibiscus syriacus TaxID=106335 RepID=UPI001924D0AB|nr:uncharacterized protein LOC120147147 [Hibiscus syriacus]